MSLIRWIIIFIVSCSLAGGTFAQKTTPLDEEIAEYRYQKYILGYLNDPRAPITAKDTVFLNFFEVDASYDIMARLEKSNYSTPFDMALFNGKTRSFVKYGTLHFELSGITLTLDVFQDVSLLQSPIHRNRLFLPFKDATNSHTTYGGGRYLDLSLRNLNADNYLRLDFNKAYNPWCVYADDYNCPIPPKENHLDLQIPVGEKDYLKEQ